MNGKVYSEPNSQTEEDNEPNYLCESLNSSSKCNKNQSLSVVTIAHVKVDEQEEHTLRVRSLASLSDVPIVVREFSTITDPQQIRKTCREHIPGWQMLEDSMIIIEQIMSGLTNQLFYVRIDEKEVISEFDSRTSKVLFRIYGKDVTKFYESKFEQEVFELLGKFRIAPALIANFPGGRIEEWIEGVPLTVKDLHNPSITSAIASILGRFHKLDTEPNALPNQWNRSPILFDRLYWWRDLAVQAVKSSAPGTSLHRIAIDEWSKEADTLESLIFSQSLPHSAINVCFCHNDVQENNIMKCGNYLRLIDFEYSNFNYPVYDIANLFVEAMLDYTITEYPFFKLDTTNSLSEEHQCLFVAVYLSEVLSKPVFPSHKDIIAPFMNAIEWFILVSHLLWAFWSVVRSPQAPSYDEFDFIAYANARYELYCAQKKKLIIE